MPLPLLIALLVAVPLIEVYLFIEIGGAIGAFATVAACLATAAAGAGIVRLQGRAVMASARQALEAERLPAIEVFDGVCLIAAGAMLLTPGFFTDAVGFLLLVPALRRLLRGWLGRRLEIAEVRARAGPGGTIVEGEWEVVDEPGAKPRQSPPRLR